MAVKVLKKATKKARSWAKIGAVRARAAKGLKGQAKKAMLAKLKDAKKKIEMWKKLAIKAQKMAVASKVHAEAKAKQGDQSSASASSHTIRTQQKLAAEATKVRVSAEKRVLMWKNIAAGKGSKKAREEAQTKVAVWQTLVNKAKKLENASQKAMAVDVSSTEEKKGSAAEAHAAKAHNMEMLLSSSQLAHRKKESHIKRQLQEYERRKQHTASKTAATDRKMEAKSHVVRAAKKGTEQKFMERQRVAAMERKATRVALAAEHMAKTYAEKARRLGYGERAEKLRTKADRWSRLAEAAGKAAENARSKATGGNKQAEKHQISREDAQMAAEKKLRLKAKVASKVRARAAKKAHMWEQLAAKASDKGWKAASQRQKVWQELESKAKKVEEESSRRAEAKAKAHELLDRFGRKYGIATRANDLRYRLHSTAADSNSDAREEEREAARDAREAARDAKLELSGERASKPDSKVHAEQVARDDAEAHRAKVSKQQRDLHGFGGHSHKGRMDTFSRLLTPSQVQASYGGQHSTANHVRMPDWLSTIGSQHQHASTTGTSTGHRPSPATGSQRQLVTVGASAHSGAHHVYGYGGHGYEEYGADAHHQANVAHGANDAELSLLSGTLAEPRSNLGAHGALDLRDRAQTESDEFDEMDEHGIKPSPSRPNIKKDKHEQAWGMDSALDLRDEHDDPAPTNREKKHDWWEHKKPDAIDSMEEPDAKKEVIARTLAMM
eukprot:gnl/TRDRNA2_/TRDRNA2_176578_c4_seq23.p1 gnl/TRDRNA2_/TRDRNA2_176578_c4~~gnl/TRDRNA2_/TRDRNA2_176578_c4_seq23.p1  ORF type:complete len:823 (+),score=223.21 gnl/TRDRNA2_/TRDRNA2_176578_c4_seq23:290-2470(+)